MARSPRPRRCRAIGPAHPRRVAAVGAGGTCSLLALLHTCVSSGASGTSRANRPPAAQHPRPRRRARPADRRRPLILALAFACTNPIGSMPIAAPATALPPIGSAPSPSGTYYHQIFSV